MLSARDAGPATSHPQPLLRRPWYSLDGPWGFCVSDETRPGQVEFSGEIQVPFAPGTPASGVELRPEDERFWYRRQAQLPPRAPGQRVLLHFGGVDRLAAVWVNGVLAGTHVGGYSPFCLDVTDCLGATDDLEVTVRADDTRLGDDFPRGKQDWQPQPHGIWYPRTSGIWRGVWLEYCGPARFGRLDWTCDLAAMTATAAIEVEDAPPGSRVRVELSVGGRLVGETTVAVTGTWCEARVTVGDGGIDDRSALVWWPRRPVLLDATLTLMGPEGEELDRVWSYTAIREVTIVDGRFCVNGRPTFLRFVLDQGYWPETGLTPPDEQALRRDLELVRQLGFNGVRKHQKTEDPRFFALADQLGIMVWVEMPSAYRSSLTSAQNLLSEWAEIVSHHRGHPSVVAWVPLNESWGVPAIASDPRQRSTARAMAEVARALDGSRPVTVNDGWETTGGDIIGIHDYGQDPAVIESRYGTADAVSGLVAGPEPGPSARRIDLDGRSPESRAVLLSEFGGIALTDAPDAWGYTTAASPDDLLQRYRAQWAAVHASETLAGACWTQLTDTYQEANGLLFFDRTPKAPIDQLAAATRGVPDR